MGGDPNCLLNGMILQVGSKLPFFQIIQDGHSSTPISTKAVSFRGPDGSWADSDEMLKNVASVSRPLPFLGGLSDGDAIYVLFLGEQKATIL